MSGFYRATTPPHTFTLPIDTSTCKEILVTYKQGNICLNKHYQDNTLPPGMTLDAKKVMIELTQDETLMFKEGDEARVQVRVLTMADKAYASKKFKIVVNGVLNEEILA